MSRFLRVLQPARCLILLLPLLLSACQLVMDGNYTLGAGEAVSGSLVIPSANVTLEEGSRVGGSTVVFCCNVRALGDIGDDLFVVAGNVLIGPQAVVDGDVTLVEGNLSVAPQAHVGGRTEEGWPARVVAGALALMGVMGAAPVLLVVLLVRRSRKSSGIEKTGRVSKT